MLPFALRAHMSRVSQVGYGHFTNEVNRPQNPNSPDFESLAWRTMAEKWSLIDDLLGGTKAMREAQIKWLPREKRETWQKYWVRLHRSFLFEGFKNAKDNIVSKPFSRTITVQGDNNPDWVDDMARNTDLMGRDLTTFCKSVADDAVAKGLSHMLVDYPSVPNAESLTRLDEIQRNLRPFVNSIKAKDLFFWRGYVKDGQHYLSQIRFKSSRTVADGAFGEEQQDLITQITAGQILEDTETGVREFVPGEWVQWARNTDPRAKDDEQWILTGPPQPFTFPRPWLPLVTYYTEFVDFMEATPPLEPLAWTNLQHWQSASDQRNILSVARVGILHRTGVTEDEAKSGVTIGTNNVVASLNPDAKLEYVEYKGKAADIGRQDLIDLKEEMELFGLKALMGRSGGVTATARVLDEGKVDTDAQMWVTELECALKQVAKMWQIWLDNSIDVEPELPDDLGFSIFKDFAISVRGQTEIAHLVTMRRDRLISHETFLLELKKRQVLSESLDVEVEKSRLEDELEETLNVPEEDEPELPVEEEDPNESSGRTATDSER